MFRYFTCHKSKISKKNNLRQILNQTAFRSKSLSVFVFRKSTDTGEDNPFDYAKQIGLSHYTTQYMKHEKILTLSSMYYSYSIDNSCLLLR